MEQNNEMMLQEESKIEVLQVNDIAALEAINRSEIDMQIATAHQYPRNLSRVLNNVKTLATIDEETAASCFYILSRQGKVIEGPSVRLAEIVASSWGNLRVQARIIGNDGKMITAQGICHDLETNSAVSVEVKRRITDKYGKTFSADMQTVTGNAACAIAMRNALFKVVPMSFFKSIINEAKQVSIGKSISLEERRTKMIDYYAKIGVDQKTLFDFLSVSKIDEIDTDMVVTLHGLATAIREGTTTVQETFFPKTTETTTNKEEVKPSPDLFGGADGKKKEEPEKKEEPKKEEKK